MNREEYFKFHEAMTEKMNAITRAKNADYTGAAGDDPFANFNRVASLGVCSTEQGFMVRMLDKYMRINSFVQKGFLNVKDESVEDTLLDLANYAILFAGYLKSKQEAKPMGECGYCMHSMDMNQELILNSDGRIFHAECQPMGATE